MTMGTRMFKKNSILCCFLLACICVQRTDKYEFLKVRIIVCYSNKYNRIFAACRRSLIGRRKGSKRANPAGTFFFIGRLRYQPARTGIYKVQPINK